MHHRKPAWAFWALLGVLLLAAAGRILHLDAQSLWIDEGTTWANISPQRAPNLITALAQDDVHPPLYFWLLRGWAAVVGTSVFSLRAFSALPSVLSAALVVPLARAIQPAHDRRARWLVPLLAALLLALSDPEIVLAQDVRMYALRTLLTIASFLAYVRWLQRGTRAWGAAWVAANVLLLHTQYMGLFVAAVQGLHALLVLRGRQRLAAIGGLALVGALFAPWFFGYGLGQLDNDQGLYAALPSNWATLLQLRDKFLGAMWPLMLALLGLGALALAPGQPPRLRRPAGWLLLLGGFVVFTLVVTYIGNRWVQLLAPHRIVFIAPALAVLAAQGLAHFRGLALGTLSVVLLVYGVTTVDDYYPKEPWREVGVAMTAYAQPGHVALAEVYRGDFPLDYYLDHLLPPGAPSMSLHRQRVTRPATYADDVRALLAAHDTAWLAYWSDDPFGPNTLAAQGFVPTADFGVAHLDQTIHVYRYDRWNAATPPMADFAHGARLHRATFAPVVDGSTLRVEAWWGLADDAALIPFDASVSAFLLHADGTLAAQHDGFPQQSRRPTSTWRGGEIVYDPHDIDVRALPPGAYTVALVTYTWYDGVRYATTSGDPWVVLGTYTRR